MSRLNLRQYRRRRRLSSKLGSAPVGSRPGRRSSRRRGCARCTLAWKSGPETPGARREARRKLPRSGSVKLQVFFFFCLNSNLNLNSNSNLILNQVFKQGHIIYVSGVVWPTEFNAEVHFCICPLIQMRFRQIAIKPPVQFCFCKFSPNSKCAMPYMNLGYFSPRICMVMVIYSSEPFSKYGSATFALSPLTSGEFATFLQASKGGHIIYAFGVIFLLGVQW